MLSIAGLPEAARPLLALDAAPASFGLGTEDAGAVALDLPADRLAARRALDDGGVRALDAAVSGVVTRWRGLSPGLGDDPMEGLRAGLGLPGATSGEDLSSGPEDPMGADPVGAVWAWAGRPFLPVHTRIGGRAVAASRLGLGGDLVTVWEGAPLRADQALHLDAVRWVASSRLGLVRAVGVACEIGLHVGALAGGGPLAVGRAARLAWRAIEAWRATPPGPR